MKADKKARGRWLIVLGAVLMGASLFLLYRVPSVAQYMAPAPVESGADNAESALTGVIKSWETRKTELGTGARAGLAATVYESAIESSAGESDAATLTCVSAGWFDAHPKYLKSGRLFTEAELTGGAKLVVLDEELAFKLFPTTEPIEGKAQIGGAWYEVIGVVRHSRGPGDADQYGAYIPIATAAKAGMQASYLEIDCALDVPGAARAVENIGADVLGAGSFYDIDKEAMRASMIVRVLIVVFALYILAWLLRGWNARTRGLIAGWRAEVMHRYFKKMLPSVVLFSFLQILGYAVLVAAAYGVLALTIRPMYVFTEWIPEVIVEWSKISARAQALIEAAAAPVKYQTREYAAVRFYGALVRWGAVCALAGGIVGRRRRETKERREETKERREETKKRRGRRPRTPA